MDKRILTALDGSEHSKIAVSYAVHPACRTGAELIAALITITPRGLRGPR